MISEARKDCVKFAERLGDYQHMEVADLLNGLCAGIDINDSEMQSEYLGALLLRFWYKIGKLYISQPTNTGFTMEDCFNLVSDAIMLACQYRAWQDPEKNVNANQAVQQCIETTNLRALYQCRLDIHAINHSGMVSLDTPVNELDGDNLGDLIEDETESPQFAGSNMRVNGLIQQFLSEKKVVEAIILACIAFNDCEKETKETVGEYVDPGSGKKQKMVKKYREFWPYKLVKTLNNLPADFESKFKATYIVQEPELAAAMNVIRNSANYKLYKEVEATLKNARKSFSY